MIALSPSQPDRPLHGLWSLWDIMKTFSAGSFFSVGVILELASETLARRADEEDGLDSYIEIVHEKLNEIRPRLEEVSASYSIKAVDRIIENIKKGSEPLLISGRLDALAERIRDELDLMYFLHLSPSQAEQFNTDRAPFGDEVEAKFASANDDIYEALKCLSLERSTACVLHLMRVLEIGLFALAKAVGVPKQNDWGKYIEKIRKELDTKTETSRARSPDEQFYAEAAANFDRLRRAFRNPTMHPEKTYTEERAEDIWLATKSFMNHLATRLCEEPEIW
jgi:hypothetical protein